MAGFFLINFPKPGSEPGFWKYSDATNQIRGQSTFSINVQVEANMAAAMPAPRRGHAIRSNGVFELALQVLHQKVL